MLFRSDLNTGGNNHVSSGNSSADSHVLSVANSNIDGGTWWLVIVNKAGEWIGKILGAPKGATYAGSSGTDFAVNEKGEITAILGNGASSSNTSESQSSVSDTTSQANTAQIQNKLNLSANTSDNKAPANTGGASNIKTGDATIIANLVNFVNINIANGGKLVVTVVNVFGSWLGDFVSPGTSKVATGGFQHQRLHRLWQAPILTV